MEEYCVDALLQPLAFIALLSNVAAVTKYFPDLQQLQKNQPQLFLAATSQYKHQPLPESCY